jgi:hypothetical protein
MTMQEKAAQLYVALLDAYRDEDRRELESLQKIKMANDATEDFTAMLLAVQVFVQKVTGWDGDIIDFTHMLNKLAVQYVLENNGVVEDA